MQRRERRGDEGAEDAERMPAGDRATQRAEAAGPQYPVQHQVGADVRATVPEAPGETAEHEQRQRDREPRDRGLLRQRLQPFDDGGRSEEHTSELQSLMRISYAVFCLKKKKHKHNIKQESNRLLIMNTTNTK